jgi:hypothetical protein
MQLDTRSIAAAHMMLRRAYDATGNMIETHEHAGDLKEW